MHFFRFIKVKDKLLVLMIVCVLSNVLLGVFSVDYLRKCRGMQVRVTHRTCPNWMAK